MKVYVHGLRDLIKEVEKTVKILINRTNITGNSRFAERLRNAETAVNNISKEANVTGGEDSNNLNTTIDVLRDLTTSVGQLEKDVKKLKQQQQNLESLVNITSNDTKISYKKLHETNNSRLYVKNLRNIIESFVQPLELIKTTMMKLNNSLWSITDNLTKISESALEKMIDVHSKAKIVQVKLDNNTNKMDILQNQTQSSLKHGGETWNVTEKLSRQTNNVFNMSKVILRTINQLTEVIKDNKDLTRRLNDSISSRNLVYHSTIHNSSKSVKDAKQQTIRAENLLENTEILMNEMNIIKDKAKNASKLANDTLKDAQITLDTLKDFQNISSNATKTAEKSLQLINNVTMESNRSINEILNVSDSVKDGLEYTDEAMKLANESYSLALNENQV